MINKKVFLSITTIFMLLTGCVLNQNNGNNNGFSENETLENDHTDTVDNSIYHTIVWFNYDHTLLYKDTKVLEGTTPVYQGETPTKPKDQQYSYTFNGWSPEVVPAYIDANYVAKFSNTLNKYSVTWKDDNDTVLLVEDYDYGATPSYNHAIPDKEINGYRYTFANWTPALQPVTESVTYTATYNQSLISYPITYVLNDGTNSQNNPSSYTVESNITFENPSRTGYEFDGWYSNNTKITGISAGFSTGEIVLEARWNPLLNTLSVTSQNLSRGTVAILSGSGYSGESITVQATPLGEYVFGGWYCESTKINENETYTFTMPTNDYSLTAKFLTQAEAYYSELGFQDELEFDENGKIIFDNVDVTMWTVIGEPDFSVQRNLINKFNDEYAGKICINLVAQSHADYYPALETTWRNDFEAFPDLCFMHNEKTATYANKGYFYPLTEEMFNVLGSNLDFSQVYENIDRVTKFNGVRYAVPVDAHGFLTNFRTDIILKNGCGFDGNTRAIPKSRAEYQSLLKNLKDKAAAGTLLIRDINRGANHAWKIAQTSWAPSCYQSTDPDGLSALYANDGHMTSEDGRTITFQNNEGFKTYIKDQVENFNKGYFTNGTNTEYFPAGNVAMFNEGPWWASMYYGPYYNNAELLQLGNGITQDDIDNYGTPYTPMHPDGWWSLNESSANAHKWYGNGYIMALTKHIKDINVAAAAVEFINWYINGTSTQKINGVDTETNNLAYWCSSGHMPAWKSVYNSAEYNYYVSTNLTLQALGNPEDIIAMESHPFETTMFNALANCVQSVQDQMRASTPGNLSLTIVDQTINEVVASAQAQLDMYYEFY